MTTNTCERCGQAGLSNFMFHKRAVHCVPCYDLLNPPTCNVKEETIFQVGDKIEWNGMFGEVIKLLEDEDHLKLSVDFTTFKSEYARSGRTCKFTLDGKWDESQKESCLKLVSRAEPKKEKKKIRIEHWKHIYIDIGGHLVTEETSHNPERIVIFRQIKNLIQSTLVGAYMVDE